MSSRNPYLLDPNANPNLQGGNPFMIPAPDSGSIMQPAFLSQAQNDMPQYGVQSPSSYLRNGTSNSARIQNTGTILSAGWNDTSGSNTCSCGGTSSDPSSGSQLPTIANRTTNTGPTNPILPQDPGIIIRRPFGDILFPYGNNGLGDNPFFGDTGSGGWGSSPDPGNWVGPGSQGGSGGTPDNNDPLKLALLQQEADLSTGLKNIRDATKFVPKGSDLYLFEGSWLEQVYRTVDSIIDLITNNVVVTTLFQTLLNLIPIGLLAKTISNIISVAFANVLASNFAADIVPKVMAIIRKIMHLFNDIDRQVTRMHMAQNILDHCPPQFGTKCDQARFDLADSKSKLNDDVNNINFLAKQLLTFPILR